jgi:hypothetical protein
MKQLLTQLLCIIAVTLSSCGNTEQNKEAVKTSDSIKAKDTIAPVADLETMGFYLEKNESFGEIKTGLEAKALLKMMGTPDDKTNAEMCEADGAYHQTWDYSKQGIKLDMIGKPDSVQVINMITISEPCTLKTKKGIGIGSSLQEVTDAYKEAIDTAYHSSENIIAGTVYGGMQFGIENKKVKSIFIGASAE